MAPPRTRPPAVADERTQLLGWLDLQRAVVHVKAGGLSEEDAHRSLLPTSPLMTVAGVVSHLRWVEHCWFEVLFLGGPADGPMFAGSSEDEDMRVEGVPLDRLLEEYAQQCARSDEIVAAASLDDVGTHPEHMPAPTSLRWILLHMLEETGRHLGQLDLLRELLDGQTGYYRPVSATAG